MSVSKGSINRVNKIKQSEKNSEIAKKNNSNLEVQPSNPPKNDIKVEPLKKINEIHEEKFKVISRIKQDIPDYLL